MRVCIESGTRSGVFQPLRPGGAERYVVDDSERMRSCMESATRSGVLLPLGVGDAGGAGLSFRGEDDMRSCIASGRRSGVLAPLRVMAG